VRFLIVLFLMAGIAPAAAAQTPSEPPKIPKWDAAATIGAFNAQVESDADRYGDNWVNTWQASVMLGRYFTPHLKTEIEWTTTGEDERYRTRYLGVPGQPSPFPYTFEEQTRVREVSATVVWQFLENQWAHPFVVIGGGAQMMTAEPRTRPLTFYVGPPTNPPNQNQVVITPAPEPARSITRGQGLLGVGGKLYMTPRVFARPEMRVGFSDVVGHVSFRIGFGVDF
jgi:hypothetical protein